MLSRNLTSQRGFSLIKLVLFLVILTLAIPFILSHFPQFGGTRLQMLNQLINQSKNIVYELSAKFSTFGETLSEKWTLSKENLSRKSKEFKYGLCKRNLLPKGLCYQPPVTPTAKLGTRVIEYCPWPIDMGELITLAEAEDYDMSTVRMLWLEYLAKLIQPSIPTPTPAQGSRAIVTDEPDPCTEDLPKDLQLIVEKEFWKQMQTQTRAILVKNLDRFSKKVWGCSDFTPELMSIWEMVNLFNEETFEGYRDAKNRSKELNNPRSVELTQDLFDWLEFPQNQQDWFRKQLQDAVTPATVYTLTDDSFSNLQQEPGLPPDFLAEPEGVLAKLESLRGKEFVGKEAFLSGLNRAIGKDNTEQYKVIIEKYAQQTQQEPDYSRVKDEIDAARFQLSDQILADITIGEIYLHYELIEPAQYRFDQAIRNLAAFMAQHGNTIPPERMVGLHVALGLLHERVCTNADLAIKEFKDALACASRLPQLPCKKYSIVHYHLGIINLKLREVKFEFGKSTPVDYLPTPTPRPFPTAMPNNRWTFDIHGTIEPPQSQRSRLESQRQTRSAKGRGFPDITKGTIEEFRPERPLHPIPNELKGSSIIKALQVEDLYDLTKIPPDAIREFELYLKCGEDAARDSEDAARAAERARVARFIHDKYVEYYVHYTNK